MKISGNVSGQVLIGFIYVLCQGKNEYHPFVGSSFLQEEFSHRNMLTM